MSIIQKTKFVGKVEIDLAGSQGNAFSLMGMAKDFCKQLGIPSQEILKEMMSGNYDNLLHVFDREFGEYVDLILPTKNENDFDDEFYKNQEEDE